MKITRSIQTGCDAGAFTLIEILIVIGIIGLTLSLGAPAFVNAMHKEGMRKAQSDLMEGLQKARGQAILTGQPQAMVFNLKDGNYEVPGGGQTQLPDDVYIDFLGVNEIELEHEDSAAVHFFPNGTSDEFVLVIHSAKDESRRKLTLDPVTALATLEDVR